MIPRHIQTILQDLYAVDPSLKSHEASLVHLIEELVKARPDTKFDEQFARSLRARLMARELPEAKPTAAHQLRTFLDRFTMPKTLMAIGSAALVMVFAVALVSDQAVLPTRVTPVSLSFGKQSVVRVAQGAYGTLSSAQQAGGLGGGGGVSDRSALSSAAPMAAPGMGGGAGVSEKMIAPYPSYQYTFVYKGEKLELTDAQLDVLKRVKPSAGDRGLAQALLSAGIAGVDLNSFSGAGLTNFELVEDRDRGYTINVNVREGSVSINQNWEKWPQYGVTCTPAGCSDTMPEPLKIEQVPSDETAISLANSFLQARGIDVSTYGQPEVENEWRRMYADAMNRKAEGLVPYVPDIISVLYPQRMQGTPVHDLSGGKQGLRVNINIRENAVVGVWQIQNQNYEASSYAAETDVERILRVASRGGNYVYYNDPSAKQIEVELGTPQRIYTTMWNYKGSTSEELLVPALLFPITKAPTDNPYFYQKYVVVPLIKDLIQDKQAEPGPIRIMGGQGGAADVGVATPAIEPANKPLLR